MHPKALVRCMCDEGIELEPVIYGGGQEGGRRAGTENIAHMVALGTACVLAQEQLAESQAHVCKATRSVAQAT